MDFSSDVIENATAQLDFHNNMSVLKYRGEQGNLEMTIFHMLLLKLLNTTFLPGQKPRVY